MDTGCSVFGKGMFSQVSHCDPYPSMVDRSHYNSNNIRQLFFLQQISGKHSDTTVSWIWYLYAYHISFDYCYSISYYMLLQYMMYSILYVYWYISLYIMFYLVFLHHVPQSFPETSNCSPQSPEPAWPHGRCLPRPRDRIPCCSPRLWQSCDLLCSGKAAKALRLQKILLKNKEPLLQMKAQTNKQISNHRNVLHKYI